VRPVVVIVLHPPPPAAAGPLWRAFVAAREVLADVHRRGFLAAGATDVRIIAHAVPFAAAVRAALSDLPADAGAIVLGSGAIPLATAADRRRFVAVAAGPAGTALANNRYSGDVVAVADAARSLASLPDLPGDNALPRWLAERAGLRVIDLRRSWHLQADLDGVADLVLLARHRSCPAVLRRAAEDPRLPLARLRAAIVATEAVAGDRRAELLVAGRLSAAGLAHLEGATACRVRALVEERGLRASSPLAVGLPAGAIGLPAGAIGLPAGAIGLPAGAIGLPAGAIGLPAGAIGLPAGAHDETDPLPPSRPPASVLGALLDRDGPEGLASIVGGLADAAIVDSRVLLAHRLGADERRWPTLEDRLASDLLLMDRVADPWLRALTASAAGSPRPILLGGHSLVGPGLRLLFPRRVGAAGRRRP
jgi:CTP:molybdopterin cytidylyltransferase MocA